jgi:hypothetical protein
MPWASAFSSANMFSMARSNAANAASSDSPKEVVAPKGEANLSVKAPPRPGADVNIARKVAPRRQSQG